jgi:uncharacterized protein (DUF1697 family)
MSRFVAFLRGINVGGHIVKKEQLQAAFAASGFLNVSTFKQSGNVIFEADLAAGEVAGKVQGSLRVELGFDVAVFVRTIPQLKAIIAMDPFKGQEQGDTSFLVTFLEEAAPASFTSKLPVTIPKSTAQVICACGTEVFSVTHGGGEGALPNPFVESKLKVKATTRNMNVIRELIEKFG